MSNVWLLKAVYFWIPARSNFSEVTYIHEASWKIQLNQAATLTSRQMCQRCTIDFSISLLSASTQCWMTGVISNPFPVPLQNRTSRASRKSMMQHCFIRLGDSSFTFVPLLTGPNGRLDWCHSEMCVSLLLFAERAAVQCCENACAFLHPAVLIHAIQFIIFFARHCILNWLKSEHSTFISKCWGIYDRSKRNVIFLTREGRFWLLSLSRHGWQRCGHIEFKIRLKKEGGGALKRWKWINLPSSTAGDVIKKVAQAAPVPWPISVTLLGSPPNSATFSCSQWRAIEIVVNVVIYHTIEQNSIRANKDNTK